MTNEKSQNNIDTIREILADEIRGDVESALKKMHGDYSMTWVYKRKDGVLFPRVTPKDVKKTMDDVYKINDREYSIKNIVASDDVVMAELSESYSYDGKTYRTPMVIVWEFENGKIKKGRHYCDPQLSYMDLTPDDISKVYE